MGQLQPENIPAELKQIDNWVLWKREDRDSKQTKVPYQRNGRKAASTASDTWTNFPAAVSAYQTGRGKYDGIGFCLTEETPIGIDLDHCRCPAFVNHGIEIIAPWAQDVINKVDSYTEASPSGKGIRIFANGGKLPAGGRKNGDFEIYQSGRYLTVTGDHIKGTPKEITNRPDVIEAVFNEVFGTTKDKGTEEKTQPRSNWGVTENLEKAFTSKSGEKIRKLYNGDHSDYPSQSEADLSLCSYLAFWFGNDAAMIDTVFRASGLYRPKWDKKHHADGSTYGQWTIEKAIRSNKRTYPEEKQKSNLESVIDRLAALPPLDYDKVRKTEAKLLEVRPTTLDAAVKEVRKRKDEACDLPFTEPEPWPEQVDPATLLNEIKTVILRFIICSKEVAVACALWISMTWMIEVVNVAPLIVIAAPEKRCGKTLLLSLLSRLSSRAITASSISPSALFRAIEAWTPTLFIDEADACLKDNEELRGILNSGHTRDSAYVIRTVGDNFTPTKFNTFGAKAIAGIGHLADTLMDRAVVLELWRKTPEEKVDRIRNADPTLFSELQSKLARFAEDHSGDVRQARPPLPPELNDREQDNWQPLLAIASIAGKEWLQTGTDAAKKLSGSEGVSQTIGIELLSDIQKVFKEKRVEHIFTADLITALCADDEKPWKTYSKGFQITPKQLANKLKAYGVYSGSVRIGADTGKGYTKDKFADAFSRYIPLTAFSNVTKSQPNKNNNISHFSNVTQCDDVTDQKQPKAAPVKDCDVVTDRKLNREEEKFVTDNGVFDFSNDLIEVVK